jgi:hypothetical protein
MKTRLGKITLVNLSALILVCVAIWIVSCLTLPALAAGETYPARTFILPYAGETAKTIVLEDRDNGNAINGTLGTSTAATTWDAAEIAGTQHAITNDWVFSIPAHSIHRIILKRYDVAPASIDKTTVSGISPLLYNPKSGLAYTDTNPIMDNMVNTTGVN